MSSSGRSWIIAIAIVATMFGVFLAGCSDDPFYPRPPSYDFTVDITGLDGFTTTNGSAVIMVPIPSVNGEPILKEGWWPNNRSPYNEEHHGTLSVAPAATIDGPMLAIRINMTDYYDSYARVTPIAVNPGQNASEVPTVVPDRIRKPWSFDNVSVIASGNVQALDQPTSDDGRAKVSVFLDRPLLPAISVAGRGNYTSYVYFDENLVPLKNDSAINVTVVLTVQLNHNKMNVSEEPFRSFETHTYTINDAIKGGKAGFIPVSIHYSYTASPHY